MKSSFDGSCAFDGSSCGNAEKPSMASLIIVGCALDDEIESPSSVFEEEAAEYHRLSPRRRKGSAEKRRSAKRVVILCIREEEGKQERFSFVDNDETVRLLEILD